MNKWIVPFAEIRLFFRSELMKFVESMKEPELFLTHQYWPPIESGQIFVHEMQLTSYSNIGDPRSLPASGHRVYVAYGGPHEQCRKRAESVANKISDHLRTYSSESIDFGEFTMQVRSFDSLSRNIVSFNNVFCIDGFYATLRSNRT